MIADIANLQFLVVGLILFWAGSWKVFVPRALELASSSALSVLFPQEKIVRMIYRVLGIVELAIGLSLIIPPIYMWEIFFASILATIFLVYLLFSIIRAPDKPCGCLGGRVTGISWRTMVRAGLLLIVSLVGWLASDIWFHTLRATPWLLSIPAVEVLTIVALSPEIDWAWLFPKPLNGVNQLEANCTTASIPHTDIVAQLKSSPIYQKFSNNLVSEEIVDHWFEDCWHFVCISGNYMNCEATVVFAVPDLLHPQNIRAAIVDRNNDRVLLGVNDIYVNLGIE